MHKFLMFVSGLLAGSITGGMLALLLAPQSGMETQNQIRGEFEHLIAEGKTAAEARRQELETQLETFKQGQPIILQTSESNKAA